MDPETPAEPRELHPSVTSILRYFSYDHLGEALQAVSAPFCHHAHELANQFEGPELTVCLRKLLEAKDAAVRCALDSFAE